MAYVVIYRPARELGRHHRESTDFSPTPSAGGARQQGPANSAVDTQDSATIGIGGLAPAAPARLSPAGDFPIRFSGRIKPLLAGFAPPPITAHALTPFVSTEFPC